ncbi:beta-lactamase family protein (plasmid) [Skermanella rosea]|uniref:serine hydrolase domain-containing protein n=1 Tax=Skermanella rosea TaxID=1817965 RepID=UPI0019348321|nr:serine hydrolase domain-containing protein [Skermanella rosea]UEM07809.1 beta-lactamase family protein [Skermanella rosea]
MKRVVGPSLFVIALCAASAAWAQALPRADPAKVGVSAERLERIGQAFQKEIDAGKLPGAVMMVARDGQLVYAKTLGHQDKDAGKAMEEGSIFRIYSMTKPLVSVAAMILYEEGRIELTDPVSKFLPEFDNLQVSKATLDPFGKVTYATEPVARKPTVQDLLRHTAGLAYGEITQNAVVKEGYAKAGLYKPADRDYDSRSMSPEEQVKAIAQVPLVHQPGTRWEYSLASDILGRVVEKAAGMRLSEFLEQRVFQPLKMNDSGFSVAQADLPRLAEPLKTDPATGTPNKLIDVSAVPANDSGGAGAVSTAADYLRFTQMLLNGGELDGARILSPTTIRLMASDHLGERIQPVLSPGELLLGTPGYSFGLGFSVRGQDGIAGVSGSAGEYMWAGYAGTFFWVDPEEDLTAVLMTQAPGPSRPYYRKLFKQLVYQSVVETHAN